MTDHSPEPDFSAEELADLDRFASIAAELTESDTKLETPPASVWAGIEQSVSASAAAAANAVAPAQAPSPTPAEPIINITDQVDVTDTAVAAPDNLIQGPWGKPSLLLGAVAAALLLFVGAFVFTQGNNGDTIAEVALEFTEGPGFDNLGAASTGNAAVLDNDGSQCLDLELSSLPEVSDAYLEVWLIDTNVEGMVSLGPIDGDSCVSIPASVDPGAYPVVDISIEPTDGEPTHSGRSILRGVLDI